MGGRVIMKLNVSPFSFEELVKKTYSLDHVYLLLLIQNNIDIKEMIEGSERFATLHGSLIRKGLLSEDGEKITIQGKELLDFISSPVDQKIKRKKIESSEFDRWWKTFPGTDTFEYKGKKFIGSRSLRQNKEECKIKFDKILSEGEYTTDILIQALELDLKQKAEASIKTGNNKLSYMQNSLTYLRQRTFEAFIELMNGEIVNDSDDDKFGGTDI
jgi:hypothetical protein